MFNEVATEEDSAVDGRMECLDAASQDFGEAGDLRDIGDREPCSLERLEGAAGGDKLIAGGDETSCEWREALLVGDRQQSAWLDAFSRGMNLPKC